MSLAFLGLGSFVKLAGECAVLVIFWGSGKLSTEAGESTKSRFERACQNGGHYQWGARPQLRPGRSTRSQRKLALLGQ